MRKEAGPTLGRIFPKRQRPPRRFSVLGMTQCTQLAHGCRRRSTTLDKQLQKAPAYVPVHVVERVLISLAPLDAFPFRSSVVTTRPRIERWAPVSTPSNYADSERSYEDLRREVMEGSPGFAYGLAIFLQRGMAAWLDTLAACAEPSSVGASSQSCALFPSGTRGQVVHVLARMVLDLCTLEGA